MKSNKGKCHFGRDSQEWKKKNLIILRQTKNQKKKKKINIFKGCLPQILLRPFLNTLTHLIVIKSDITEIRSRGFSIKSSSSERLLPFMQQSK